MKKKYIRPKSIVVVLDLDGMLMQGTADVGGPGAVVNPDLNPDLNGFPSDEE